MTSKEPNDDWLKKRMEAHKIQRKSTILNPNASPESASNVVATTRGAKPLVRDDWLPHLGKKAWEYVKPSLQSGAESVAAKAKGATSKAGVAPPVKPELDLVTEIRAAAMFVGINMVVLFLLYNFAAFTAAPLLNILVFNLVGYVAFRFLVLSKLKVVKEFDSSRCAGCLKNMKQIYGIKDGDRRD